MYLCILKVSSIDIHGFHEENSSVVGLKENSSVTRAFVPNPSSINVGGFDGKSLQSTPGKEASLSFMDMHQAIILCILVFVISMLVLVLIWCSLCYLYVIQWMSGSRDLWNSQPKQSNTFVSSSTNIWNKPFIDQQNVLFIFIMVSS